MKRSRSIILKSVAFLCAIMQSILLMGTTAFAVSNEDVEASENEQVEVSSNEIEGNTEYSLNNSTEETSTDLLYSIDTPIDLNPNIIRITFDATDVVDYSFEAEGLTVVESEETPMVFDLDATNSIYGYGKFEIELEKIGDIFVEKTIFTYSNGTSVFVSDVSKDSAWLKCKQYEHENDIISAEEMERQYSESSLSLSVNDTDGYSTNDPEVEGAIDEGKLVIVGRMTWETESGTVLPMRHTKVGLFVCIPTFGQVEIASGYTGVDGYYHFVLEKPDSNNTVLELFVRTYIESDTFAVMFPFFEEYNYYDSESIFVTHESDVATISRKVVCNSDRLIYQMIHVQQGMVLGQRFATEMGMEADKKLYVYYSGEMDDILGINYTPFCYDIISFIPKRYYNDFLTTIHEYGHFVENRMGNYGDAVKGHVNDVIPNNYNGKIDLIYNFVVNLMQVIEDYSHGLDENHFGETSEKAFQMELTWSEAWAYAFAEIAMQRYRYGYEGAYNYSSSQFEANKLSSNSGEAQEYAVISFLWDLYDFYSIAEPNDNISMTAQEWWNLTTKAGTYTLQDLTKNIIENYPELIDDVGEILGNHQISPQIISVLASPCTGSQLRLKWKVNGAASYPNDLFRVFFYDEDNNMIARGDPISCALAYSAEFVYTVPTDLWNEVQNSFAEGKTIYAVVYGYRTGDFTSGPYFSEYIEVWDSSYGHVYNTGFDEHTHWLYCSCGYGNSGEAHDLTYMSTQVPLPTHSESCDCGYIGIVNHDYYEYTQVGTDYHKGKCVCGNPCPTEEHSVSNYVYKSAASHYAYCECGHLMGTYNHTIVTQGVRSYCTGCRHLFLEPGATNSVEDPIESLTE